MSYSYFFSALWPFLLFGFVGLVLFCRKNDGDKNTGVMRYIGFWLIFMSIAAPPLYLFQHVSNQFRALEKAVVQFTDETPSDWQSTEDFTIIHVGENAAVAQFPDERYYTIERHDNGDIVVYMNGKPLMSSNPANEHVLIK